MEYKLLNNIDKSDIEKFFDKNTNRLIIAGPCSVESYEQYFSTAKFLSENGVNMIRGGAYKPRTSPFDFQGLGKEAINIMSSVKNELNIKIVTEALDFESLETVYEVADILQIGSRNMQNFGLLKEIGKQRKPVILKRGLAATVKEWLNAAEYIAAEGNQSIIMCERGIRTFSDMTRNTLDLSVVPLIKQLTDLPIIVDPSHGTGISSLIEPMSKGALAVGADGLMIEVHPNPKEALSDGHQSLSFSEFEKVLKLIK